MNNYTQYNDEQLLKLLADSIQEYIDIYFETGNEKTLRELKKTIRKIRKEINTRISTGSNTVVVL